jgi:hypothetical protein
VTYKIAKPNVERPNNLLKLWILNGTSTVVCNFLPRVLLCFNLTLLAFLLVL